jgi:hypothetical protein
MVSTPIQQTPLSTCPVCHQTASAKRVATLYETTRYHADARFVPPAAPREQSYLIKPITLSVVIETITLFAVMVICASNHFSVLAFCLALIGICTPLVLSAFTFRRMLAAEKLRVPKEFAWDEAMVIWNRLRYCAVDDMIFDPALATTRSSLLYKQAEVLPVLEQDVVPVLASVA